MKKIETKRPIFTQIQVDEIIETQWETKDGKIFNDERSAENWEFYQCKLNRRGGNTEYERVEILDLICKEDLERYITDYGYGIDSYDYNKDHLIFPGTYVSFNRYENDEDSMEDEFGYKEQLTIACLMDIEKYKKMMIDKIEELK